MSGENGQFQKTLPGPLREVLVEAARLVLDEKCPIRLITHFDADGITAAGILASALQRMNSGFHVSFVRKMDDALFARLAEEKNELVIFTDLGSGKLARISTLPGRAIVLDHHKSRGVEVPKSKLERKVIHINTHEFGIDGTFEASGATMAFLLAIELGDNWDLSSLALAGAIGDKMHLGGFSGLNASIASHAAKMGLIEIKREMMLGSANVMEGLLNSVDPYFRGLSGNDDGVSEFLGDIGLTKNSRLRDLDEGQHRALSSLLLMMLLKQGARPEVAEEFIGDMFWLRGRKLYASELSDMIDACGRKAKEALGFSLCLNGGSDEAGRDVLKEHGKDVLDGLAALAKSGFRELEHIQYFDWDRPAVAGRLCGIGARYLANQEKPLFSFASRHGELKISARGTRYLLSRGLDLADACQTAAGEVGGEGGGHPIAAGATIPDGKQEEFLQALDRIIGGQMGE